MNWNKYFDAIWCINFAPYTDRKKRIIEEFDRVGILKHSNFCFYHTFDNMFDKILFDVTKNLNKNSCEKVSELNLAMGHYSCIKASYDAGYERILIFEDDIKFLTDISTIEDYIKDIPSDADIVLFSQNPGLAESIPKYVFCKERLDASSKYIKFDYTIWDSGFYMLSRNAMGRIIREFEKYVMAADVYISSYRSIGDVNRYYSLKPLGIQLDYSDSINSSHFFTYANMKLDVSEYGERFMKKEDEDIRFSIVIPAYNAGKSIRRCIESIKSQEYGNYSVVIVDDVSDDNTYSEAVKSIGRDDRFKLFKCREKMYGGGARNYGLDKIGDCDYVLFLDSDDYYYSKYTLSTLRNKIVEKNRPDCVLCPFIDSYHSNSIIWMNFENVSDFMRVNPINAPWVKCVKKELVRRFDEGDLIGYDDVLQHYRQMDSIRTIEKLNNIAIVYTCDSTETVNNTKTIDSEKKRRKDIALVKTITNVINEKFVHGYVKNSAFEHFVNPNIRYAFEVKNALNSV